MKMDKKDKLYMVQAGQDIDRALNAVLTSLGPELAAPLGIVQTAMSANNHLLNAYCWLQYAEVKKDEEAEKIAKASLASVSDSISDINKFWKAME